MTEMTAEEVQAEIIRIREIGARIRAGKEPELAQKILDAVEKRVLTEQPEFSPKELYDRHFGLNGNPNDPGK